MIMDARVCYICDTIGCDYVAALVHASTDNLLLVDSPYVSQMSVCYK